MTTFFEVVTFSFFERKHEALSNTKLKEVLNKVVINTKIYMGDSQFTTRGGILNLHPTRGTHWVFFINEKKIEAHGCQPPTFSSKYILQRNGKCVLSEFKIQEKDSLGAAYCLLFFN